MEEDDPKFALGSFVRCHYDYFDFYSYFYEEAVNPHFAFYGLIVEIAPNTGYFETETVYKVYCMDGCYRFFLEDELCLV